jgi:hypothetical protein
MIVNTNQRALKKREQRAEKARKEGRRVGVVGRPPIIDNEANNIITKKIIEDAEEGNFHDVAWLMEMVISNFI